MNNPNNFSVNDLKSLIEVWNSKVEYNISEGKIGDNDLIGETVLYLNELLQWAIARLLMEAGIYPTEETDETEVQDLHEC